MRLDEAAALRREPRPVSWEGAADKAAKPKPVSMKLHLALPPLKVALRPPKPASAPSVGTVATFRGRCQRPAASPPFLRGPGRNLAAHPRAEPRQGVAGQHGGLVMQEYLKGIGTVSRGGAGGHPRPYLRRFQAVGGARAAQPAPMPSIPLLAKLTSLVPGQELTAVRQLSHGRGPLSAGARVGRHGVAHRCHAPSPSSSCR